MRKQITDFLRKTLIHTEFSGIGKYYASEVTIDYGTNKPKRVDFMQFVPPSVVYLSNIEKGKFICYEVKSCVQDVYSGKGLNFYGEKNYIVTTMETYKKLQPDIISGKLDQHIRNTNAESSMHYGIMVAVPEWKSLQDEYENPTSLDADCRWALKKIVPCHEGSRQRSMIELLFCMLRSGTEPARHGKWLDEKTGKLVLFNKKDGCPERSCKCSVCGKWLTASDEYPVIGNYCPNCGAKMDAE